MKKVLLFGIAVLVLAGAARAGEVVMKTRVTNPLKEETVVPVKQYLPKGIKRENIIDKGNFLLRLDNVLVAHCPGRSRYVPVWP